MKIACALAFGLLASLQASTVSAQVYQWKDSTGRTVISDTPPPTTKNSRAVSAAPAAVNTTSATDSAPKTTAEKDMEFRKRQKEAREKAEKEAQEQKIAAEKKDYCQRARQYLGTLESGELIATRDENGQRQVMDSTQRQRELDRARQEIAEHCK